MRKLIAGLIKWKPKTDPKSERSIPSRTVVPPHEVAVRHAQAREEERTRTVAGEPAKAPASKDRPDRTKKRSERNGEQSPERVPVKGQPDVGGAGHRKHRSSRDETKEASTNREAPNRRRKRRANDPTRMPEEKVGRRRAPAPSLAAREARAGDAKAEKVRRRLRQVTFGGNLLQDAATPTDKRKKKVNKINKIRKTSDERQPGRDRKGARRKTGLGHL